MTLNNNDLRTIERALGMVLGISDFGNPGASTLVDAVEMIDAALDDAEKREKEKKQGCEFCEAFKTGLRSEDGLCLLPSFCPRCGTSLR